MSLKKIEKLLSGVKTKPKKKIVQQLVELGPDAILVLLQILMAPEVENTEHLRDQARRDTAAAALVRIGKQSSVPFIIGLQSCHGTVRAGCAYILGCLPNNDAELALLEALEMEVVGQPHSLAFGWIAWALVQKDIDAQRITPWLLNALQCSDASVRASAVGALGDLGDETAIEPLLHVLIDPEADVRYEAIEALAKFYDERLILPLIQALDDTDVHVRCSAVDALKEYEDARSVDPLIALLQDPEAEVRWWCVDALGHFSEPRVLDALISCLEDSDLTVRRTVCKSLRRLNNVAALEPLMNLQQKESDPFVSAAVQKAIQKLKKLT